MSVTLTRHKFAVDAYRKMVETGILTEDLRVELLNGEVLPKSAIGRRHAGTVNLLTRLFTNALGNLAVVSVQNHIVLPPDSAPEPDLTLLKPRDDLYAGKDPTADDVLLLIEVGDATAEKDRMIKLPLYAAAGIREVWLIDLVTDHVEVHRRPTPQGYTDSSRLHGRDEQSICCGAFPEFTTTPSELLGLQVDQK